MPQPMQRLKSRTAKAPSIFKASIQQRSMQAPQPTQASSSMFMTQLAITNWLGNGERLAPLSRKQ
jgi:hypothetical protein